MLHHSMRQITGFLMIYVRCCKVLIWFVDRWIYGKIDKSSRSGLICGRFTHRRELGLVAGGLSGVALVRSVAFWS